MSISKRISFALRFSVASELSTRDLLLKINCQ